MHYLAPRQYEKKSLIDQFWTRRAESQIIWRHQLIIRSVLIKFSKNIRDHRHHHCCLATWTCLLLPTNDIKITNIFTYSFNHHPQTSASECSPRLFTLGMGWLFASLSSNLLLALFGCMNCLAELRLDQLQLLWDLSSNQWWKLFLWVFCFSYLYLT